MNKSKQTTLRSRPNQARSRATFDKILVTAAELLEEVGWDGFNTNLLAERSGYRVSAIYRYFPNKIAVVSTLAEQIAAEWDDWALGFATRLDEGDEIKATWSRYVREFPSLLKSQTGGIAVRRAMQASPALRMIDQKDNELLSAYLAKSIRRVMPRLDRKQAASAARILMESVVSLLDLIMEAKPVEAQRLTEEMLAMHHAYFDQLAERK